MLAKSDGSSLVPFHEYGHDSINLRPAPGIPPDDGMADVSPCGPAGDTEALVG